MQQKIFSVRPEYDALKILSSMVQGNKPASQICCTAGDVDASRADSCLSHEFSQSNANAPVERHSAVMR